MAKVVKISKKPKSVNILDPKDLAEWIKYKRTTAKLTIEEAAGLCNINKQTFANIEKGHCGTSILKYLEVASSLGITIKVEENINHE